MREILFRGKTEEGIWIFGDLIQSKWIKDAEENTEYINPETVGQFTGLADKNGTKIFEGDVVKCVSHISYNNDLFYIDFEGGSFCLKTCKGMGFVSFGKYFHDAIWSDAIDNYDEVNTLFKVIGNIHDNPELL